jgi:Icc protein
MWRKRFMIIMVVLTVVLVLASTPFSYGQTQEYQRLVIISDLHYPAKRVNLTDPQRLANVLNAKQNALMEINKWDDVTKVILTGDLVGECGSPEEYAETKKFLDQLQHSKVYLVGNHDYLYIDHAGPELIKGNANTQKAKLERFRQTFGVKDLYYSERMGAYLLVYLACDYLEPETPVITQISAKQLAWLRELLAANRQTPTIVFFHAPLINTVENYSYKSNHPNNIAMPDKAIDKILKDNPQVFMWVSGHIHIPPTNPSFCSKVNYYEGRVLNVQNDTWDHQKTIDTNSLYLYPDKVVVRTYNHQTHQWMTQFDRTVPAPQL